MAEGEGRETCLDREKKAELATLKHTWIGACKEQPKIMAAGVGKPWVPSIIAPYDSVQ